ncbi:MAG: TlyA family RNA methyltransferase [Rhizobiaceae bacterium]
MITLPDGQARKRLDQALVDCGLFATRARSRDAILRGTVRVNGVISSKPAQTVFPGNEIEVNDPGQAYVSRAALKLIAGLDHFGFELSGRTALDIGASTGGFTQVLLERGVNRIYAIDVGRNQLHEQLVSDDRVISIEGLNARDLGSAHLDDKKPGVVVSDVSFISIRLALPPALALADDGAVGVFLVKPQFESGHEAIGKGGLLKDPDLGAQIADDLSGWLAASPGWHSLGICPSPIAGGDGNHEFLLGGKKDR